MSQAGDYQGVGAGKPRSRKGRAGVAGAIIGLVFGLGAASLSSLVAGASGPSQKNACGAVAPGFVRCLAVEVTPKLGLGPLTSSGVSPAAGGAFGPSDLISAYNLPQGSLGTGQTVAIVDAYDDPSAESDLGQYRSNYGLPACTTGNGCFLKVDQNGGSNYPSQPPAGDNWATEISLDIDMVSAICPNCHIILVEAADNSLANLAAAENEAAKLGASQISNSYGGPEASNEKNYDADFSHTGIAITVATGDNGYGVYYPAASPGVTAVGGTTLTSSGNSRGWSETAWNGAGSGCSGVETQPSWQAGNGQITGTGCKKRAAADVSAVADPNTPVWIYDSYDQAGWYQVGGTSVATPVVASIYALADRSGDTSPGFLYGKAGDFYDVTSGSNGSCGGSALCKAGSGWDGPTGLGTPDGIVGLGGGGSAGAAPVISKVSPNLGPTGGGQLVSVTGSGFAAGMWITIGGHQVRPDSMSATAFSFTTPAGSVGTEDIQVTTGAGASGINGADQYNYAKAPSISGVSPNQGPTGGGQIVQVSGSGFGGGMSVHLGSAAVSPTNVSSGSFSLVTPAMAAGTYQVQVGTAAGNSPLTSADDYSFVSPGSTPTISSVSPAAGPSGGGQTVRVTGSGFGSGMTGTLGGNAITPTSITASSFSFVTPAGTAGYAQVQVTRNFSSSSLGVGDGYIYAGLGSYFPLSPFRILDTRSNDCYQCGGGKVGPGGVRTLQITGVTGLPSGADPVPNDATAVVLNVTAVDDASSSLLTVYPAGTARPTASNLNFGAGGATANLVVATLGQLGSSDSNREVNIYNALGSVDVVADVEGYFGPQSNSNPVGEFHSISPLRVCDTRARQPGNGCNLGRSSDNLLGAGQARLVNVTGVPSGVTGAPANIPTDGSAAAGVFNLTVISGNAGTYVSVYPPNSRGSCASRPGVSNINLPAGIVQDNRVMVGLGPASSGGPNDYVCVFNAAGSVEFILDANGWLGGSGAATGAQYQAIGPSRVCDTRSGSGTECAGQMLSKAEALGVQATGIAGIPGSGPVAIIGNLTAVAGSAPTYLTVYPDNGERTPNASDVNVGQGEVLPNLVVVELGGSGSIKLYNAAGNINAVLDVEGWFQ